MHKGILYWVGGLFGYLLVFLILLICLVNSGCGIMKGNRTTTSTTVHDTIAVHDIVAVHDSNFHKETIVLHDTPVGISGGEIVLDMGTNTLPDTNIRKGPLELDIHHGRVVCKEDSLTLVIRNLQSKLDSNRFMSNFTRMDSVTTKGTTIETIEPAVVWYKNLWESVKNLFAFIGLGCVVVIIIRFTIKKAFV